MTDTQPKPTAAPTTDDLRQALNGWDDRLDFDRWLAEHDAQVEERVLRRLIADAAGDDVVPLRLLRARADRIEREGI